jgi:hypothetical protein
MSREGREGRLDGEGPTEKIHILAISEPLLVFSFFLSKSTGRKVV